MQADGGDNGKGGVAVLERPSKGGVDSYDSVMPSKSTKTGADGSWNSGKSENASTTDENGLLSPEPDDINADIRGQAAVLTDEDGRVLSKEEIKQRYRRPYIRKSVRNNTWDSNSDSDGYATDPVTQIKFPKEVAWDLGHKPGFEFWKHVNSAIARGISRKQFIEECNDPRLYRPELPSSNRSHAGETVKENLYFDIYGGKND